MTKNHLGIMQGRLLPKYMGRYQAHPVGYWHEEFAKAASLGLSCIEFILDFKDAEKNPLLRPNGPEDILAISEKTGIKVFTVCADYFMEAPLHHIDEEIAFSSERVLKRLLENGQKLGLTDIIIPCVDMSSITDAAAADRFVSRLLPLVEIAEKVKINLALETDLAPQSFTELLDRFNSACVTVNYDTGNSASLGYDPAVELAYYGTKITDIHIKDRKLGSGSVILGTGDTQFKRFFDALRLLNYSGPFIMQAYRDEDGVSILKQQLGWLLENFAENI